MSVYRTIGPTLVQAYRKVPKFSETRKLCCILPKIQTMEPNLRVFRQKDANGIANSEDPDQTAPKVGLHCLLRPICQKTYVHYDNFVVTSFLFSVLIQI